MSVTMEQVRAALLPDEPRYARAARLGAEAMPFLDALARGGDLGLAAKAVYLAGLIGGPGASAVAERAARSGETAMRGAAASAARHLDAPAASRVLLPLLADPKAAVRKLALRAVPAGASPEIRARVEGLARTDREPLLRELSRQTLARITR